MFSLFNVLSLLFFLSPCFHCNPDSDSINFLLINGNDTLLPEIGN